MSKRPTQRRSPDLAPPARFRASLGWWQVRDSNPRRLSRLIYSQIPLAARVTCRVASDHM